MFFSSQEDELTAQFLNDGYVILPVDDKEALDWIRVKVIEATQKSLGSETALAQESDILLDQVHNYISTCEINKFRLSVIDQLNGEEELSRKYFEVAKRWVEILVGNELAMQRRINLSIQMPGDDTSLLEIHADTWSGDSPFEVVVWVPLVNCYGTKAMYLLPPDVNQHLVDDFASYVGSGSENLFATVESEAKWLEIEYGNVLIFDQRLAHGNRLNTEEETRWSMNCRFKGIFTPYGDKKIGEFFEPITLRAASRNGMSYRQP